MFAVLLHGNQVAKYVHKYKYVIYYRYKKLAKA